jgi:PqqD family protein of HPr-rel-A system
MTDSWRPVAPHSLVWRQWDDDVVLYNDVTGSTHQLGPLGGEVMLTLLQHPSGLDLAALVRDMPSRIEISDESQLPAEVKRALDDLVELQLAARFSA